MNKYWLIPFVVLYMCFSVWLSVRATKSGEDLAFVNGVSLGLCMGQALEGNSSVWKKGMCRRALQKAKEDDPKYYKLAMDRFKIEGEND